MVAYRAFALGLEAARCTRTCATPFQVCSQLVVGIMRPRPMSSPPPSGYTPAMSRTLMPPSVALSRMACETDYSVCRPKVMVASARRDTVRPVRPRRVVGMLMRRPFG